MTFISPDAAASEYKVSKLVRIQQNGQIRLRSSVVEQAAVNR